MKYAEVCLFYFKNCRRGGLAVFWFKNLEGELWGFSPTPPSVMLHYHLALSFTREAIDESYGVVGIGVEKAQMNFKQLSSNRNFFG